jgi:hypothetical protein
MSTIQQAQAAINTANRLAAQEYERTNDSQVVIHGLIPSDHGTEIVIRVHLLDMNYVYEVGPIVGRRGLVSRNAFITTSRPKAIALLAYGLEYRKSRRKQRRLFA